ncbi:MAG: TonB-dependent receptor [Campylobacterota bacterium]|nr:TonB-dependent receptor [Campylobacterota bacterium]
MKRTIALSLATVLSVFAAESVENLDAVSIVGNTESHANNIVDTSRIETSTSVQNPLNLLNNIAGVYVTSGSSFGLYEYANQVNMRGFTKGQIAFLVDGVPLGSSATAGGAPVNRFVENENLSSVVVFQGSGSLATPSASALGGTIDYVTALPSSQTSIQASTTTGSFGSNRLFSRIDTGEFAKDSRAYLSFSETTTNKWKNEGELKRQHLDAKIMTQLGGVDMQLNVSWNDRQDHDYLDISKADYDKYGRDFGLNDNWVTLDDKAAQTAANAYNWDTWQNARTDMLISMNVRADIDESQLKVTPYYHDQSGTGNWAPNYVLLADGSKNYEEQSFRQSEYFTKRYGMTLNWDMPLGDHEILAGAWLESGERENKRYWYNIKDKDTGWTYDKTPYFENFNRKFDTTSMMAYLQGKLNFLDDALTIDLGGKTQITSVEYTDVQNSANSQGAKESSAPFLPQLGITYKLNHQNQIFTSFAMNSAQLPDSIYTGTDYDPDIEEEESTNIDLGYRFNSQDTALTATVYYVDYRNKIENITASPGDIFDVGQSYAKNVGGVESKGLELSGLYMLSSAWKLSATYTYNDSTYKDNVGDLDISGNSVPFLPKHMATLALDYKQNGYLFGANLKQNSDIYGTRDNKEEIEDYTITNFYIGYNKELKEMAVKNINLMLNVNNAFDADYLATAGAFGDNIGGSTYFVGAPRNVTFTLGAAF